MSDENKPLCILLAETIVASEVDGVVKVRITIFEGQEKHSWKRNITVGLDPEQFLETLREWYPYADVIQWQPLLENFKVQRGRKSLDF